MNANRRLSIAVVIPNYNRPRMVAEAVESVLAQRRTADEILVVDDGSRERSEETVRSFGEKVGYVYQENRGLAGARNTGIRRTRSDLLVFLDDDDLLEPGHLEALGGALETDSGVSVAYGDALYTDLEGRELGVHSRIVPEIRDAASFAANALSFRGFPPIHSAMFRRGVFEEHGFFNETYPCAEDVEMWLRIAPAVDFAFVDEIVCRYRKHGENMVLGLRKMEEQHTRGLRERYDRGDLPKEYARLEGPGFANLALTYAGHYVRAGERGEGMRCVTRIRRASGRNPVVFWLHLAREYLRRRAARWRRNG